MVVYLILLEHILSSTIVTFTCRVAVGSKAQLTNISRRKDVIVMYSRQNKHYLGER